MLPPAARYVMWRDTSSQGEDAHTHTHGRRERQQGRCRQWVLPSRVTGTAVTSYSIEYK